MKRMSEVQTERTAVLAREDNMFFANRVLAAEAIRDPEQEVESLRVVVNMEGLPQLHPCPVTDQGRHEFVWHSPRAHTSPWTDGPPIQRHARRGDWF